MKIQIRKASQNNLQHIVDVYKKDNALSEFPTLNEDVASELNDNTRVVWIALDNDHCVGTVALVLDYWQKDLADGESIAMVKRLRVAKDYEGKGVATLLNNALENEARALNLTKLSIEVHEDNNHARSIYEHWGYELLRPGYRMGELSLVKNL